MFVVKYKGNFGFIKPWTAVRDDNTFSQQFLTPSIIEGMEKELFPELLNIPGIHKIVHHKLKYDKMDGQQEVILSKSFIHKNNMYIRGRSIVKRFVLVNPQLWLAFAKLEDAQVASEQHLCLCRNEDILLPDSEIAEMTNEEFEALSGFELKFEKTNQSILVGYNRFNNNKPMYGWLDYHE